MNYTDILVEHTDAGAFVRVHSADPTFSIRCPRCGAEVRQGAEHRCGDQVRWRQA